MEILVQPDSLSMVGSMNPFEIYTTKEVTFVLREKGSTSSPIVQHTYTPNGNNLVTLKMKDIITPLLSFKLVDASEAYVQPNILKTYEAVISEVGGTDSKNITFTVIRAGVDKLSDSAANFLKNNFLTWQPSMKAVTYYSPEFLTYYAQEPCLLKCKAYLWKNDAYESKEVILASMDAGNVYTIPVQYALIAKEIGGDALPSYYDVWVETVEGARLTYIQRYYADNQKSEEEEWFLFENSLGGIDCFRAYGNSENTAEHTHNVAEIEEDSEEYRVDTTRKYKKSTGYLGKRERQWMLDFFPSLGKYRYAVNAIRKITVTESDVNYEAKELPTNYTFTYKFSDARPYLNLSRTEETFSEVQIHVPDLGNFTIAPRLAEFPRQGLNDGTLFPVQSPYSEKWGVTTLSAIFTQLVGHLSDAYEGGGGVGHQHKNFELLDALSEFMGYITYHGEKLKAGVADKAEDFTADGAASKKLLRKDIEDVAQALINFKDGAKFGEFIHGILLGKGGSVDNLGNAEFESITSRSSIIAKELIVNRQTAIESNFFASESGIVESVVENRPTTEGGNTTYDLKLQKRWDNDFTAFREQDCIRASINTLMEDGKYYDMWLRVLSVNAATNTITVVMYPDDEVPSGKNHPPVELARLVRWGNAVDKTRQRVWYLSSETGTIILLNHVMKPIIDRTNYSIAVGLLPGELSFVFQDYPDADVEDGAIYTKWIAAQNVVYKDYEGNTKQDVIDRGQWSLEVAKSDKPYHCLTTEVHDVWHYGCRWRCLRDCTTEEPRYASIGWAFVEGNPEFTIDIQSSNGWRFSKPYISNKRNGLGEEEAFTVLSVTGKLYNRDVTSQMINVVWTRDTGDPAKDNVWAQQVAQYANHLSLPVKASDLGDNWGVDMPCIIKCSAEIKDGETYLSEQEIEF